MAKKAGKTQPKKECPSCGLGVSQESTICEFCGWDFQEEDEWILQIEKLERDLMLEKQKFEPGTVNHMIEATLRTPSLERLERGVPEDEEAVEIDEKESDEEREEVSEGPGVDRAVPDVEERRLPVRSISPRQAGEIAQEPSSAPPQREEDIPERRARTPPPEESPAPVRQRKVRTVASSASRGEEEAPVRRTRTVRKVKQ